MVEISLHKPVKQAIDPNNLSPLEMEHLPIVVGNMTDPTGLGPAKQICRITPQRLNKSGLMLAVWINHEMIEDHHIKAIAVGDSEKDLVRAYLSPNHSIPRIHLTFKLTNLKQNELRTLKIHACCNKHGCWETEYNMQILSPEKNKELLLKDQIEVVPEEFCNVLSYNT